MHCKLTYFVICPNEKFAILCSTVFALACQLLQIKSHYLKANRCSDITLQTVINYFLCSVSIRKVMITIHIFT
jgi:hypothetical protein